MSDAYATGKTVHAALKRLLAPWFTANGWQRRTGYSCAFVRPTASGCWCLWIQVSSWGSRLWGGSFTLNLVHQDTARSSLASGAEDARVLITLDEADRAIAFQIAQLQAARIPEPSPSDPVHEWAKLPGHEGEHWRKMLATLHEVNPDAWEPGVDVWLPYYSAADLEPWVEFLLPRLPHLLRQSDGGQGIVPAQAGA